MVNSCISYISIVCTIFCTSQEGGVDCELIQIWPRGIKLDGIEIAFLSESLSKQVLQMQTLPDRSQILTTLGIELDRYVVQMGYFPYGQLLHISF